MSPVATPRDALHHAEDVFTELGQSLHLLLGERLPDQRGLVAPDPERARGDDDLGESEGISRQPEIHDRGTVQRDVGATDPFAAEPEGVHVEGVGSRRDGGDEEATVGSGQRGDTQLAQLNPGRTDGVARFDLTHEAPHDSRVSNWDVGFSGSCDQDLVAPTREDQPGTLEKDLRAS